MAPARSAPGYSKDEKVLCFHGPLLYDAKITELRRVDPKDARQGWEYKVHYKGWKNTWDDWTDEGCLMKLTEENRELERSLKKDQLQKQRAADQAKKASTATSKRRSGIGADSSSMRDSEDRASSAAIGSRGTKRSRADMDQNEKEETFIHRPSVKIILPDVLKSLLVDDWENVTKNLQLVPLPHVHSIRQVLNDYFVAESNRRTPGSADAEILEEVVHGIEEYFDKSVGRILLYRFERQQWLEINQRMNGHRPAGLPKSEPSLEGKRPCDIYGAEHLARLFCSMPELIAQTNMDQPAVTKLKQELQQMTSWLGKHADKYFAEGYEDPGGEYQSKVKGTG
ncbi:hypothetical protein FH972_023280 [Carpinus fangiana]|uniref:Chromatin modification-related protein EAF3 n=1 Tax=Carpinus fangiana TaxID=176857 RepID=A0A5N6KX01_9ROSI|nr:hypothetical protein FH972_023280 [Carpinus fangiana]